MSGPIHVLHVIYDFGSDGAAEMLRCLCAPAPGLDVETTIVYLGKSDAAEISAYSCNVLSLDRNESGPGSFAFVRLARLIDRIKPDVVQAWDYSSTLIATIAKRLVGPDGPDLIWVLDRPPPMRGRSARFLPGLLALFSDWPNAVVVKSEEIKRMHAPLGYHSRSWHKIPFGVVPPDLNESRHAHMTARLQSGIDPAQTLIMQVAGADWVADVRRFLTAAKALHRTDPHLAFAVLTPSDISASDRLTEIVAQLGGLPKITYLTTGAGTTAAICSADILVAAGDGGHSVPNHLVHALAEGVPCITNSGGDADDLLTRFHLVVPPDDPAALAGALRRVARMAPDKKMSLSLQLKQVCEEFFDFGRIRQAYFDLLSTLVSRHRQARAEADELRRSRTSSTLIERLLSRSADGIGLRGKVSTRTLAGTVLLVALMTAVGRSATFVREIMVAAAFGTGPELEAYFLALAIPTFLTVSTTAAIPAAYARLAGDAGPVNGRFVLGRMTFLFGLVAGIITLLLTLTAPIYMPVLGRGLPPETTQVAIRLVPWVCAIVPSQLWVALWTMSLNMRGWFAWPALLSALTPFGVVAALILASGDASAETLARGTAAGALVETVVIVSLCLANGITFKLLQPGFLAAVKNIGRETGTVVLGTISLGAIALGDQIVSAQVGPGSVGAFFLGSKVIASITGISAIALSQAVLPRISQLAAIGDRLALVALSRNAVVVVTVFGLVASGLVSAFSEGIVDFVFARGRFGAAETEAVAAAQAAYAWHIAPFLAWIVISRILVTLGASRSVLGLSAFAAAVNFAMDLAVAPYFGVPGIALTTAVTFGLLMGFGAISLSRVILPQH